MTTDEKYSSIARFAKTLDRNMCVIFSDDGNLKSIDDFVNEDQSSLARSKPYGLWYAKGGEWIKFLTFGFKPEPSSYFENRWAKVRIGFYTHAIQLVLNYKAVYRIRTNADFVEFSKKYGTKHSDAIKWYRFFDDGYAGIEVKRMQPKYVEKFLWIDDWDVAGGCIWDKKAIKEIKLLRKWTAKWKES